MPAVENKKKLYTTSTISATSLWADNVVNGNNTVSGTNSWDGSAYNLKHCVEVLEYLVLELR